MTEFKKHKFAFGTNSFMETENRLFFSFRYGKQHFAMYNKKERSTQIFTTITDDINFPGLNLDLGSYDYNHFCSNGYVICLIRPGFILENRKNIISPRFQQIVTSLREEDNPVLFMMKIG
jgi:hypothetical protein